MGNIKTIRPKKDENYFEQFPNDWEIKSLGSLGSFSKGKGVSNSDKKEIGVPCITYGEIYTNYNIKINNFLSFIDRETALKSYRLKSNSILFAGSGETLDEIGKCIAFTDEMEAYAGGDIVILEINRADCVFLSYLLSSNIISRQRRKLGQGHSIVHIYANALQTLLIPVPPLSEQRKIAAILSTWDLAIERTQKLIEAKTRLKRGLMQQLLIGKSRFIEFINSKEKISTRFGNGPSDWKLVRIGDIADEITSRNSRGDSIPVLSCTKYDGLVNSLEYFGKQIFSRDTSNYKVVNKNQFAYATNHIEEGSIGLLTNIECGLVSPMYTVFKVRERVKPSFLFKLFKTELYRHIFEVSTSSSVNRRGSLRWKQFAKIQIALPSVEEQARINEVIENLNKELQSYKILAEQLQNQKKALMQVLLTGKIRVRITDHRGGAK